MLHWALINKGINTWINPYKIHMNKCINDTKGYKFCMLFAYIYIYTQIISYYFKYFT